MAKERLMTKDFITVAVINFLMYMIFYLLMVIIAGYAIEQFGASTGMAGLVSGIFIIGILFGRLGAGRIIETVGSKNILIAGSISCIITSLLYFAAVNIFLMTIIRFLHGAAYGIASTATGTIVASDSARQPEGGGDWVLQSESDHRRRSGAIYRNLPQPPYRLLHHFYYKRRYCRHQSGDRTPY